VETLEVMADSAGSIIGDQTRRPGRGTAAAEQHRIDYAENGRVGADAEAEDQHRHGAEDGVAAHRTQSVLQVVPQIGELLHGCYTPVQRNGYWGSENRRGPAGPVSVR
jgi:hypothetical protein